MTTHIGRLVVLAVALAAGCNVIAPGSPGECGGAAFGTAACTYGPTEAPGGLSRDAAVAAARGYAPPGSSDAALVWAAPESNPFAPRGSIGSLVWEVRLAGAIAASPCPSGFLDREATRSDPPCLDGDSGLIVVIDFFSGSFLGWLH